jgi:hypothetical protein
MISLGGEIVSLKITRGSLKSLKILGGGIKSLKNERLQSNDEIDLRLVWSRTRFR